MLFPSTPRAAAFAPRLSFARLSLVLAVLGLVVFELAPSAQAADPPLTTVRVASGLARPLFLTAPPGDLQRLFIVEQRTARILILKNGSLLPDPFLDINSKVIDSGNERGLLGLAFHPDYASNGSFYVNYNRNGDGDTVIARYHVSDTDPDRADPASEEILLLVDQPFENHNGGMLAFGPDGYLYIGLGDGGGAGDPDCRAQRGDTLLGKMLRVTSDGQPAPGNPFLGDPTVLDEIWAFGLRNPWRYGFDRLTGDVYIADVGQNSWEEIDFQPAASTGGENYGWKVMEGNHCFSTSNCPGGTPPCNDPSFTDPIHEYSHSAGCSITGGYVYRGCTMPDLQGTYFFADYCSNKIWSFRYDGTTLTDFTDRTAELEPDGAPTINSISSFGEDALGELYIVDQGGEVFKIVPRDLVPGWENYGTGWPGTNGIPDLVASAPPALCQTLSIEIDNSRGSDTLGALFVGLTEASLPTQWGGTFLLLPEAVVIFPLPSGGASLPLAIPCDASLCGLIAYFQVLESDPGASAGVSFTPGLKLKVGGGP
ncbi:MAG: PQQ-dependent sugar dehydrogenase [Planctomycetota bacterium]